MLSQLQVLQVTNPLEIYPTLASSRRAQVTVLHCSIVRNINRVLHISVPPNVDGQEGLYYYIIHSVHCSAGNYVLIEDNFQGIVKWIKATCNKTPCLICHYLCFELRHEGEIYFHVCLQGTLAGSIRNKILPVEARWPWTHRLNDRRYRLRQSVCSVSWIMCLYYNLFGIFNKLNF